MIETHRRNGDRSQDRESRPAPLFLLGFGWRRYGCRGGGFLFFEDGGGSSDAVAFVKSQETNALRGAARFANFARVHADHFALMRDDHHVGIFAHLRSEE